MRTKYDKSLSFLKLKGKIVEKGKTLKELAKEMGVSQCTISKKINGKTEFNLKELKILIQILEIDNSKEIEEIFFK